MRRITKQTAMAIAALPAGLVAVSPGTDPTQPQTTLPDNQVVVSSPGDNSNVSTVPDPGAPDLVLTSGSPGQLPRWQHLAAIHPTSILQLADVVIPPDLTPEQRTIIDQIVQLLYTLIRTR